MALLALPVSAPAGGLVYVYDVEGVAEDCSRYGGSVDIWISPDVPGMLEAQWSQGDSTLPGEAVETESGLVIYWAYDRDDPVEYLGDPYGVLLHDPEGCRMERLIYREDD